MTDHTIQQATFYLIAASTWVLFVAGGAMTIAGAYSIWFKPPDWREWLASAGVFTSGLLAVAIALHFTL